MKAKMKVKGPLELEFEITGTRAEANDWLDRAVNFLDEIEPDKVSLKLELKEIVVPEKLEEAKE